VSLPPGATGDGSALLLLGDVQLGNPLGLTQSPDGTVDGPADPGLVYNSDEVSVRPVVQLNIASDSTLALPPSYSVALSINGTAQATVTYATTGFSPGDVLAVDQQAATALTSSGRFGWLATVTANFTTPATLTVSGYGYAVAEDGSALGAGWEFAPTDQLFSIAQNGSEPAGVLRAFGTGGWRFYQSNGNGTFQDPAGDNGTLTQTGGTYTYQTPDGQTWTFNSAGYQTQWASADGQEVWQYRYDGSNRLTRLTAPDGAVSTLTYGMNQVTVQTVNGRTTTLALSSGNLTQVTNADGGVHSFAYDSLHHATAETDGLLQNAWQYTSGGPVGTITWGSGSASVSEVTPEAVSALTTAVAGSVHGSLTDPDGHTTLEWLDANGRLTQEVDADGGLWKDGYSSGFLTSQTDALGRITSYALDAKDFVTLETLPDGSTRQSQYQSAFHALTTFTDERGDTSTSAYDSQGHLTSTTDATGATTTQTWINGLLQSVTDPDGHNTTNTYDTDRRLTGVQDALGNRATYTYDGNGTPLTATDARGDVSTTAYDVMGRLTATTDAQGARATTTYDVSGLELTATDPLGNQTSLTYDANHRGLVTQEAAAAGTPVQSVLMTQYDPDGRATAVRDGVGAWTDYAFDPVGRETAVTDPLGDVSLSADDLDGEGDGSRDPLGGWTSDAFNARGWLTQQTDPTGAVSSTAYDRAGNATTVTDALSHTTTTAYDRDNRPTTVTDALGDVTTTAYDRAGNVTSVTDPRTDQTTYAYDADNRLTAQTDAAGTAAARTETTGYDGVGDVTSATDALGHTTTTAYDKDNRATTVTDALSHTTTSAYDAAGDVTTMTDPLSKVTSYAYDALERLTAATDALSHTATTVYDADSRVVAREDALLHTSRTVYDADGRVTVTEDPRGDPSRTQYDAGSDVAGVVDALGNATTYVDDRDGREVSRTDALGHKTTTAYDAAGRVTSVTDRDNRQITYAYDQADRLTAATWLSSGGAVTNRQTFTYDSTGNELTAADNAGTYTLGYDALNRLTAQTDVWGLTLTYSYDSADRRTQVQDSLGGTVTSVYDNANRLTSRSLNGGTGMQARADLGYDNRDEPTNLTRYSDLGGTTVVGTTVYGYDDSGRVTAITNQNGLSATLSYYDYGYDAADRVTSQTWSSTGTTSGTYTYTYDAADQLLTDGVKTYSYDTDGNRTMAGYQTGSDNRLSTDGTWTYTYDAEGNETQKTQGSGSSLVTWTYSYDNANRMVGAVELTGGSTATTAVQLTYTYDVFGDLVQDSRYTSASGLTTVTRHAYDGGVLWADLTTGNAVLARYLNGDGADQVWARAIPTGQTNAGVAWYLTDRLGSVRDLMNGSSSTIGDHLDYNGYGGIVTETNATFSDAFKYDSGRTDPLTGETLFGGRWYDAATGRWTSQDPLGFGGGDANLYRYSGNTPENLRDPSGLDSAQDELYQGAPIKKEATVSGPDVTDWFAEEIVAQLKWRKAFWDQYYTPYSDALAEYQRTGNVTILAGAAERAKRKLELNDLGPGVNQGGFYAQGKYGMSAKWMAFGGPKEGVAANTVAVCGIPLKKNQLGNIELLIVATLYPPGGELSPRSVSWISKFLLPGMGTYDSSHPQSDLFGRYTGKSRTDNVAAFGVGTEIGEMLSETEGFQSTGVPTVEEVKAILAKVFTPQGLADGVNRHSLVLLGRKIGVEALTSIPTPTGLYNTRSLLPSSERYDPSNQTGINYFMFALTPRYLRYTAAMRSAGKAPLAPDFYLQRYYERYDKYNGAIAHPGNE
jgi:RHS repeat-associated protein